jgi:hypothetical protein
MHTAHLRSLTVIRVSNRREGKGRTNGTVLQEPSHRTSMLIFSLCGVSNNILVAQRYIVGEGLANGVTGF